MRETTTGRVKLRNNGRSPWSYTNFAGIRLAMMVDAIWGDQLTTAESYLLVVLYGAMIKNGELIDHRVTELGLANRCRVSLSTVKRAMRTFRKLDLIIVEQEAEGQRAAYYRVPYEDIYNTVERALGHSLDRGYD